MMKILATRMAKQTIDSIISPILSLFYHYFHSLLMAPTKAPPPNTAGAWTRIIQCMTTVLPLCYSSDCFKILYVFINLPLITSSLMNPLVQTFSHSPKNYGIDRYASRTYGNSPSTWVTPLVLFGPYRYWYMRQFKKNNTKLKKIILSWINT